jgi:HAD superfamily hydrolase (TIGR01509 family)
MPPSAHAMQPEALLLDMDGTLVQTEERWGIAERLLMTDLGGTWTEKDQAQALGGPLERVIAYMIGKTGGEHDHQELMARLVDLVEQQFRSAPLIWSPGMVALVEESHRLDVPVALVTASASRLAAIVVESLALQMQRAPFGAVVTAEDVVHGKPAPDPYVTAAARLGVSPDRCLAIEDSPTGIRSALDAGCQVLGIEHMARLEAVPVLASIEGYGLASLWALVSGDRAQHGQS